MTKPPDSSSKSDGIVLLPDKLNRVTDKPFNISSSIDSTAAVLRAAALWECYYNIKSGISPSSYSCYREQSRERFRGFCLKRDQKAAVQKIVPDSPQDFEQFVQPHNCAKAEFKGSLFR